MRLQLIARVAIALGLIASVARADDPPSSGAGAPGNAPIAGAIVPERADDPVAPDDASADNDTDGDSDDSPTTGALQGGVYADSDHTRVLRSLATVAATWGNWGLNGRVGIDSVTSASLEVRSSPALSKVDTITSASGRTSTSGGEMTDVRAEVSAGGGWSSGKGTAINLTASGAAERDYKSLSAGATGSIDILDRTTTLLAGVSRTQNWIASVLDTSFAEQMAATGWSAGVARVLTPTDAIRARYDGRAQDGYNASPYRTVRFGNWTTSINTRHQVIFANTIGDAGGLPEQVPEQKVSHAVALEWLHSLRADLAIHPMLRVGHDSWGSNNLAASIDLRVAEASWRMQLGYRYYTQSGTDFFLDKYTADPSTYAYYTSDKELGPQRGHLGSLALSFVLRDGAPATSRLLLDLRIDGARYAYPGYTLLPSRSGVTTSFGLTWEP